MPGHEHCPPLRNLPVPPAPSLLPPPPAPSRPARPLPPPPRSYNQFLHVRAVLGLEGSSGGGGAAGGGLSLEPWLDFEWFDQVREGASSGSTG
jgi:hypothetical protein